MNKKLALRILIVCAVIAVMALALTAGYRVALYLVGKKSSSRSQYSVSKLELYRKPTMVAIHLKNSQGVFLIRGITRPNEGYFLKWICAANADITSINVGATSINHRWSNAKVERDELEMVFYGHARGKTKPTEGDGDKFRAGIPWDYFPPGSFSIVSDADFAKRGLPEPAEAFTVEGDLVFSTDRLYTTSRQPRKSSGP